MKKFSLFMAALAALIFSCPAFAQSVPLQAGPWTSGHQPMYSLSGGSQPVVQDSGGAGGGAAGTNPSELGLTIRGTGTAPYANQGNGPLHTNLCDYDAPTNNSGGFHYLCISPNAQGGGLLAYGSEGGASNLPLYFLINGVKYEFPAALSGVAGPATSVVGDLACWNNTVGSLLDDCGTTILAGPNSSTVNDIATFNNTTGNLIKDSGISLGSQPANEILATAPSGSAGAPTFRSLVGADLPLPGSTSLGGVFASTAPSNQFVTGLNAAGDLTFGALPSGILYNSDIGVTVQAHSSNLDTVATVTPTSDGLAILSSSDANPFSSAEKSIVNMFSTNVQSSGRFGLDDTGGLMVYQNQATVPANTAAKLGLAERTVTEFAYTGGTSGNVATALDVRADVSSGVADFVWALNVHVEDNGPGQNSAAYFAINKNAGAGPAWGFVSEADDTSGSANPTSGLVGSEIDVVANGTDANFARIGLNIVNFAYNGGTANTVGYGILINSHDASDVYTQAVAVQGNFLYGFDTANGTEKSGGAAVLLATSQHIMWGVSGPALSNDGSYFSFSADPVSMQKSFNIPSSGNTASTATAGSATLPAAPAGFVIFNIDGGNKKFAYYNP